MLFFPIMKRSLTSVAVDYDLQKKIKEIGEQHGRMTARGVITVLVRAWERLGPVDRYDAIRNAPLPQDAPNA